MRRHPLATFEAARAGLNAELDGRGARYSRGLDHLSVVVAPVGARVLDERLSNGGR
jgi:hypothetical protein